MKPHGKIRMLLSGPGLIGRKHAELISASGRSDLVAIVAPASKLNLDFASERNLPLFDTVASALDGIDIDAAIIASPNAFHAEQALHCILKGIPVLVEKPLTADLESAAEICRMARNHSVPVLVGHHRTYSSLLAAADEFMRSDKFGELVAVQGSAMFRKPEHYFEDGPWRTRIGGGPIMINLIHDIGILQSLCGPIKAVSVIASNVRRGFDVEDTVAISAVFVNGALGTFLLSDIAASDRSWELTSRENPAYPHSDMASCYHFVGTRGSLDFPTLKARHYDGIPSWWHPFSTEDVDVKRLDPLERQLAHFEDVVKGIAAPIVSSEYGFENMRVLEAVKLAISTGRLIDLKEIKC